MNITDEYQARFEKIVDQMQQHVEMWIPDEQINLKDSFRTSIILYSFIINKNIFKINLFYKKSRI